jgi:hypothetical protein
MFAMQYNHETNALEEIEIEPHDEFRLDAVPEGVRQCTTGCREDANQGISSGPAKSTNSNPNRSMTTWPEIAKTVSPLSRLLFSTSIDFYSRDALRKVDLRWSEVHGARAR